MKGVKQSSRDSIGLLPVGLLGLLRGSPSDKGGDCLWCSSYETCWPHFWPPYSRLSLIGTLAIKWACPCRYCNIYRGMNLIVSERMRWLRSGDCPGWMVLAHHPASFLSPFPFGVKLVFFLLWWRRRRLETLKYPSLTYEQAGAFPACERGSKAFCGNVWGFAPPYLSRCERLRREPPICTGGIVEDFWAKIFLYFFKSFFFFKAENRLTFFAVF